MPDDTAESVESYSFSCPLVATHDKFNEAHYFLSKVLDEYHEPVPFRANLNGFLQALRSVTFMLQSELAHSGEFATWYEAKQDEMKNDHILKAFNQGRVTIVHRGMLNANSAVSVGLFRDRRPKLVSELDVSPDMPSRVAIDMWKDSFMGVLLDEEHSAIGEQVGAERVWFVSELGDEEVVTLCDRAFARVGSVFAEAHQLVGGTMDAPPDKLHPIAVASVLLESDLDPSLPEQWGWI